MAKRFRDLTDQEIIALAIAAEEEDGHIYGDFAVRLEAEFPATAASLRAMQDEESEHRRRLLALYKERFGDHIPLIRRQDVIGFLKRRTSWLSKTLTVAQVRREVGLMESQAYNFYRAAAARSANVATRELLGDLAVAESRHVNLSEQMDRAQAAETEAEDRTDRQRFVLQIVQPGLAGLMDGSVSTLAPLFAAAFATHNSWSAFLVGLAAALGAGISMGFAEALSDDGVLSGRGHPWLRGAVCGLMTMLGGIGHTLPFLIPEIKLATGVASAVVLVELGVIAWIRHHYMDTPFLSAALQVVVGGALVFAAGVLIGQA